MPFVCCKCPPDANVHQRGISYYRNGQFVEYCRVHDPANRRALVAARNVFEGFTLQHVRNERGEKITVNSIKELREAEKRYDFVLDCATNDNGDTSTPPQHKPWAGNIAHGYEWKWSKDPNERQRILAREEAKGAGTTTGVAQSARDTLAYHSNPV